mmetsp:Transcript_110172/g.316988  ORF Transcript_110172/g.316988 Transcript_110172/m.316988 type:complete len:913 (+) Transcript_110172:130-2868(+)
MTSTKWVYSFGGGSAEGRPEMKDVLGGKGAHLAQMSLLGLAVPPGFTVTSKVCTHLYENGEYPEGLRFQVRRALSLLESRTRQKFGDEANPLLVSVRSGAHASMPGMMDTVLNLGLNDQTVEGLAQRSGDRRFAFDCYRRFVQMYADVVMGLDMAPFERLLERAKRRRGVKLDHELPAQDLEGLLDTYKSRIFWDSDKEFPEDPEEQLWGAIGAVFGSWMNQRAQTYRRLYDIPAALGTAVNVQAMVFGNMGCDCATGVVSTRNPANGLNQLYGEFLMNAQGEDIVMGTRTPRHLTRRAREAHSGDEGAAAMEEAMPEVFAELAMVCRQLEQHYQDMQDVEFTVQKGKLYVLQTQAGKRTAPAALRMAVDMVEEGLISKEEAVLRLRPESLNQVLHPALDPTAEKHVIARGLPVSPGAACGRVVFDADEAERLGSVGESVLLVRTETNPEDIHGIHAARGLLTTRGGMTSHAAVVARGMGRPCVSGASAVSVDYAAKVMRVSEWSVKAGEMLTIDGSTGEVILGEVPTVPPQLSRDLDTVMAWADGFRRLGVRANAETAADARMALEFGAEGIGLARTEHMFFDSDRIVAMREMILAMDEAGRRVACAKLLDMQRSDLIELFSIMDGRPVAVRLLDPPLHEFIPHTEQEFALVAAAAKLPVERIRRRAAELAEANPMLGHRGCRLAVTYPEICEMQARAVFEAAAEAGARAASGRRPVAEVMLPLVATVQEVELLKLVIERAAQRVKEERGVEVAYRMGAMIELPRAALQAGEIANAVEFFSFGTNDLTQTTWGLSRDDAGGFLPEYRDLGLIDRDPFVTLDQDGVGELIRLAVARGRDARPGLKLGICGEHGGDPRSIEFCERVGLDYVSCSPFRVPIARLAAAQAALRATRTAASADGESERSSPTSGGA